jgi:Flp pilus assembly pilin Flp
MTNPVSFLSLPATIWCHHGAVTDASRERRVLREDNAMEPTATRLRSFAGDDRAATSIEYGLLASFIAMVMLTAVATAGLTLAELYSYVASQI